MKVLIVESLEREDNLFEQTLEWLSSNLNITPTHIKTHIAELSINPFTRIVIDTKGNRIYLTAKEFDLLYFLYSHRGQVFSKEQLYENVWGYDDMPASGNLTSFIRKLRKKVDPDPNNPQYIITVWGVGYKFSEEKP